MPDWQNNQYLKWQSFKMIGRQNDLLTKWLTDKATSIWNDNLTKWPVIKALVKKWWANKTTGINLQNAHYTKCWLKNDWQTKQPAFEKTILQNDHYTKDWLKMTDWQSIQYLKWQSYEMTGKQNDCSTKWLTEMQFVFEMAILQNDR
jgi:hypothetical protein